MATNVSSNSKYNRKPFVRRALEKKEAKVVEPVKTAMFVKGQKTSQTIKDVLGDLTKLKAPNVIKYSKKNAVRPFEDATPLEFFSDKSDAALLAYGSHSKKHPDNLVFGRFFNYRMLDLIEFGVKNFKSMQSFKEPKHNMASRTCVIFQGEEFENNKDFKEIANILLDFFVEQPTEFVNLACLDHVIVFTSQPGTILMRHYSVILKRSGTRVPRIELAEIGPSMDLEIRRSRFASGDLKQQANTHPSEKKSKTGKNKETTETLDKVGRIHVGSQNLNDMQRKFQKGLRNNKRESGQGQEQEQGQRKRQRRAQE